MVSGVYQGAAGIQMKIRSHGLQSFIPTTGVNGPFILTFANGLAGWPLFTLMNAVNSKILIRIKRPLVCQRIRSKAESSVYPLACQTQKQLKINSVNFPLELGGLDHIIFFVSVNFFVSGFCFFF